MFAAKNFFLAGSAKPAPLVTYLIIASGGSGANGSGGGGGGGGYQTGTFIPTIGVSNPVTVGTSGISKVFCITATKGFQGAFGYGANPCCPGTGGVSGALNSQAGGNGAFCSGGGGGGGNANPGISSSSPTGGTGGAGFTSSITGTSTVYGGGGGGGGRMAGAVTTSVGGAGGGGAGNGGNNLNAAVAGSVNTGGGGGGNSVCAGGSGGSGVVILSYPNSYGNAASTTGSPTLTCTGGNKIYKFTGTGSITF